MDYEVRTAEMWPEADFELRAESDGLTLEGYAAVFNLRSLPMSFSNVGGGRVFREVIQPGAFTRSLNAKPDLTLRYQHDLKQLPLARTKSGTLELDQDERGLRVKATLPDNEWGRPVRDAIARGDISGMSFRFAAPTEKWEQTEGGWERHLSEVKLGAEVSITDYPAYPDTSVMVRHLAEEIEAEPDELADAFRALRDPEAKLTSEQHRLLMSAINARADKKFVPVDLVKRYEALRDL
jgi:HK97 family phage prohead protease